MILKFLQTISGIIGWALVLIGVFSFGNLFLFGGILGGSVSSGLMLALIPIITGGIFIFIGNELDLSSLEKPALIIGGILLAIFLISNYTELDESLISSFKTNNILIKNSLTKQNISENCIIEAKKIIGEKYNIRWDYTAGEDELLQIRTFTNSLKGKQNFQENILENSIRLGQNVGENKNYLYGNFIAEYKYLKKNVVNEKGEILGDDQFSFMLKIEEINKLFPDYEIVEKPKSEWVGSKYYSHVVYHNLNFNISEIIEITQCNFQNLQKAEEIITINTTEISNTREKKEGKLTCDKICQDKEGIKKEALSEEGILCQCNTGFFTKIEP